MPPTHTWRVVRDLGTDESILEVVDDRGARRLDDIDLTVRTKALEWYSYVADDFESPRGETQWVREFSRGRWSVRTLTRTVLTADAGAFRLRAELDAYEGDTRIFTNNWDLQIPRELFLAPSVRSAEFPAVRLAGNPLALKIRKSGSPNTCSSSSFSRTIMLCMNKA